MYVRNQVGSSLAPTLEMQTDAIRAAQHIYRRILDAMSHPGRTWPIIRHPDLIVEVDIDARWLASLALPLIDHEVSLHIDNSAHFEGLQDVLFRRTRVADASVEAADFVIGDIRTLSPELIQSMKRGSLDYPNDGATLLLKVSSLAETGGPLMELRGPGINEVVTRPLGDLTVDFIAERNAATSEHPLGIDVIVIDDTGQILALPRTTSIVVKDGGQ